MKKIILTGYDVNIDQVFEVAHGAGRVEVVLDKKAFEAMQESRQYIEKRINSGEVMYGVNTGFGAFSSVRISDSQIEDLQKNLIRSHSAGIGEPFTYEESRAIMFLRANALARGHSGIRPHVVEKILEFLNNDVIPVIPQQGSVGASGDLAPLSHLALTIIGEGEVWQSVQGEQKSKNPNDSNFNKQTKIAIAVNEVLKQKNIKPLELKAKEGLSMINGCQVMTAVGLLAAYKARRLAWLADCAGSMSLEGLRGSRKAFDPLISATRPHPGEAKTARNMNKILTATSEIADSHANCNKVQDAYSLRCIPAVHGAVKDTLVNVIKTLEVEANSSTDNPLVFSKDNKILSCGNFHGEPVAFQLDFAAIALSALASISECRIEKLINPSMSELPAFLTPQGGLNSGHMIVQVAAASLVSENKILAHPASVDSIPTSADKEDHVSMGTIASRKFLSIVKNTQNVIAMEFLSAAQALDLNKPHKPSAPLQKVYNLIRSQVPFAAEDRVFATDVKIINQLIESGDLLSELTKTTGELEL